MFYIVKVFDNVDKCNGFDQQCNGPLKRMLQMVKLFDNWINIMVFRSLPNYVTDLRRSVSKHRRSSMPIRENARSKILRQGGMGAEY